MVRAHYAALVVVLGGVLVLALFGFRFSGAQVIVSEKSEFCQAYAQKVKEQKAKGETPDKPWDCSVPVNCDATSQSPFKNLASAALAQTNGKIEARCTEGGLCVAYRICGNVPNLPKEAEQIKDSGPSDSLQDQSSQDTAQAKDASQSSGTGILDESPPQSELSSFSKDDILPSNQFTPPTNVTSNDPNSFMGKPFETLKTNVTTALQPLRSLSSGIANSLQELGPLSSFGTSNPFANSSSWQTFSPSPALSTSPYRSVSAQPTSLSSNNYAPLFSPDTAPIYGGSPSTANPPISTFSSNSPFPWQAAPSVGGGNWLADTWAALTAPPPTNPFSFDEGPSTKAFPEPTTPPITNSDDILAGLLPSTEEIGQQLAALTPEQLTQSQTSFADDVISKLQSGEEVSASELLAAKAVVEANDDRGLFSRTLDRFINFSDRAQTLSALDTAITEQLRQEGLDFLSQNAVAAQPGGTRPLAFMTLPDGTQVVNDAGMDEPLAVGPDGSSRSLTPTEREAYDQYLKRLGEEVIESRQLKPEDLRNLSDFYKEVTKNAITTLESNIPSPGAEESFSELGSQDSQSPLSSNVIDETRFGPGFSLIDDNAEAVADAERLFNNSEAGTFADPQLQPLAKTVEELRASLEGPTGGRSLDTVLEARQLAREDLRLAQEALANRSWTEFAGDVTGLSKSQALADLEAAQQRVDNLNKLVATARVDQMISGFKEDAARLGQLTDEVGAAADGLQARINNAVADPAVSQGDTARLEQVTREVAQQADALRTAALGGPTTELSEVPPQSIAEAAIEELELQDITPNAALGELGLCTNFACVARETAGATWSELTDPQGDASRFKVVGVQDFLEGGASTYCPLGADVCGPGYDYREGGKKLATGGNYSDETPGAALRLDLAQQYGCGYGSGATCQAIVEANGKAMVVEINDNGPFTDPNGRVLTDRVIDLNKPAWDYLSGGKSPDVLSDVKVTILQNNDLNLGPVGTLTSSPLSTSVSFADFDDSTFAVVTAVPVSGSSPFSVASLSGGELPSSVTVSDIQPSVIGSSPIDVIPTITPSIPIVPTQSNADIPVLTPADVQIVRTDSVPIDSVQIVTNVPQLPVTEVADVPAQAFFSDMRNYLDTATKAVTDWTRDTWSRLTRTQLTDIGLTEELSVIEPQAIGILPAQALPPVSFDTVKLSDIPYTTVENTAFRDLTTLAESDFRIEEVLFQDIPVRSLSPLGPGETIVPQTSVPPVPVQKPTSGPGSGPTAGVIPPVPIQKGTAPGTQPPSAQPPGQGPTFSSSGGGGSAGSSGGGFLQGGLGALNSLLKSVLAWFGGSSNTGSQTPQQPQQPSQPTTPTQPTLQPIGTIVANPSLIDVGTTTQLAWSSVYTDTGPLTCAVVDASFKVITRAGQSGTTTSPLLYESTRFGLVCNVSSATEKLLHETLVRVRGDDTDPPPIFGSAVASSTTGVVTGGSGGGTTGGSAGGSGSGASAGGSGGQSGNPTPADTRTCDPNQPIDSFIRCLCQVEPNPAGCTIPPGGLPE